MEPLVSRDSIQTIDLDSLFLMIHNHTISFSNPLSIRLTLRYTPRRREHHVRLDTPSRWEVMAWRHPMHAGVNTIPDGSLAEKIKRASNLLKSLAKVLSLQLNQYNKLPSRTTLAPEEVVYLLDIFGQPAAIYLYAPDSVSITTSPRADRESTSFLPR